MIKTINMSGCEDRSRTGRSAMMTEMRKELENVTAGRESEKEQEVTKINKICKF